MNVLVAVALAIAAFLVSQPLFATKPTPFRPVDEVAFNTPLPAHGPGPVVSGAITTNGCDRWVSVELLVQGPEEYWRSVGPLGAQTPIAFTALGSEVRDLSVSVADPTDPLIGNHVVFSNVPSAGPGDVETLGSAPVQRGDPGDGAAAGVVIRNWATNRAPVKATFEAKWMDPIGFRRCALSVPPLVGLELDNAYNAGDAFLSTHVPGYQRRLATAGFDFASFAEVSIRGADVDRAASSPQPRLASDEVFYTCRSRRLPVPTPVTAPATDDGPATSPADGYAHPG